MDGSSLKSLYDAMRIGSGAAIQLMGFSFPALAGPVFVCEFDELMVCGAGIGCTSEGSENIELARRIEVDVEEGKLSSLDDVSNLREASAENMEEHDGVYFFQAVQKSRPEKSNIVGWTVFLDSNAMKISGSAVNADIVLNVFGNCENQSD
jgi:hypothetical protein